VWKHFPLPFHTNAGPAAEAAAGVFALAGDTAFWRFHDKAFEEQEALAPERFEGWARQSGVVAVQRFRIGMASHEWASKVEKDKTLGERLGIRGTPQSFVNGVPVEGAQGVGRFAAVIDLEEVKAKAQLAKGTPVSRIYAEMSRQNRKMEPADDAEDDHKVWRVPVGAEPSQGPKSALVTMVEFSDFQCGFCARASGTVGSLRRHYGDLLRVVWRNRPLAFHDRAAPCAEFAMEARTQRGDPGFWAAHDALFAAQSDQSDGALATMAQRLGLDGGRTMAAVQSRAHRADLKRDADLADDLDVTGTPTFFINGRRLVGAQPEDVFRGVIDEELTKARALVAAGTPPERVYAEVTRHGIVKATPRVQP
jgi:protein-disulfide isomerase